MSSELARELEAAVHAVGVASRKHPYEPGDALGYAINRRETDEALNALARVVLDQWGPILAALRPDPEQCNCGLPRYAPGDHHELCAFKPEPDRVEAVARAPDAYLVRWWNEERPCCRVQLSDVVEPWLHALKPTFTPLYAALPLADMPVLRTENCVLCADECRGHSLGNEAEWEPEEGSRDWLANRLADMESKLAVAREALSVAASCLKQCADGSATVNDMETWAEDARQALASREMQS